MEEKKDMLPPITSFDVAQKATRKRKAPERDLIDEMLGEAPKDKRTKKSQKDEEAIDIKGYEQFMQSQKEEKSKKSDVIQKSSNLVAEVRSP
jgi:hypothetical protein